MLKVGAAVAGGVRPALCLGLLLVSSVPASRTCATAYPRTESAAPAPPAATRPPAAVAPSPAPSPVPDLFVTSVRPVLLARCAPCHEPGGKMYARLPFDDRNVVGSHSEGALRRLKGEDRQALERWLVSLKTER